MDNSERRTVKGYEGFYEVDRAGVIYSLERWVIGSRGRQQFVPAKKRICSKHGTGYLTIRLAKQGAVKTYRVHRLVAEAFIPNPMNLPDVNHKDTIKSNNSYQNLEWCDAQGNMDHAKDNKLVASGYRNGGCKLSEASWNFALGRVLDGISLGKVAEDLNVNRNTISKGLDRLFGRGWRSTQKSQYR